MRLLWAILLIGGMALPAAAQIRISPDQARNAAQQFLLEGQPLVARELARGLLLRDPNDLSAHLLLSISERHLGNYGEATKSGKKAWSLAEDPEGKFNAALVTAQALSSNKAYTRSQIWLRRAAQIAPTEATKEKAVNDLRYVRSINPWSMDYRFALRPSSNINNGSNADVITIGGLPLLVSGRNKPLSGLGLTLGAAAEYTKPVSSTQAWRFGVDIETRQYALSQEAKEIAPDASGSDFAFSSLKLHAAYDWSAPSSRLAQSVEAQIGRYRYGGEPLSNLVWLKYAAVYRQKNGVENRLSLFAEGNSRLDNHARDTSQYSLIFQQRRATESGGIFAWNFTASTTNLTGDKEFGRATDLANDAIGGGFRYTWAKPFFNATTSFGVQYEAQLYDTTRYVRGEQRKDHQTVATLSMFFDEFEYYGFAPVLDILYQRKISNAPLFSVNSFGVNLGIRSTF
ncbi:surface lipoprotein assembly modifier [Falsihalocynthiibacter sp. SS001]|uniref:surface lipoprotein assembly modifier n=1 Tax=Falsihalocynthiibacter sp. SS001 TaxID=3349698 RepID=UPI0036D2663F